MAKGGSQLPHKFCAYECPGRLFSNRFAWSFSFVFEKTKDALSITEKEMRT